MTMVTKSIPAGLFKAGCLALLDEVGAGGVELVVTKRGKPVARVVPVLDQREREEVVLARMRTRVRRSVGRRAELVTPTSAFTRWKLSPSSK
jgi:prevent-host-death family protein